MDIVLTTHFGCRCRIQTVHTFWLCIFVLIVYCSYGVAGTGCQLHKPDASHDPQTENKLLKILDPLKGHIFTVEKDKYSYTLGICTGVGYKDKPNAGLIQHELEVGKTYSLGEYTDVEIMGGTDWILLTYFNGSNYRSHCGDTNRTSHIMVICDPTVLAGEFRILEERKKNSTDNCFYLFEVGSNVACNAKWRSEEPHLSSGSVFCIIFFTIAGIYLLFGFLYQRIVVGAKGLEQIPNYGCWRSFGNLQADGCDYVCRCGPRQESQAYRGIDDRIRTDEERDDQLLNM